MPIVVNSLLEELYLHFIVVVSSRRLITIYRASVSHISVTMVTLHVRVNVTCFMDLSRDMSRDMSPDGES